MEKNLLTPKRIKIAFVVAVFADALEFPIAWIESFDSSFLILSGKFLGVVLDCIVMAVMIYLLGLQWVFFPSFCVEAVPKADMFPTWVAAVAYVVWQHKRQQEGGAAPPRIYETPLIKDIAAGTISVIRRALPPEPPSLPPAKPPIEIEISPQTAPGMDAALEQRLKRLNDLRDKNLISQTEYETKRGQILADI